MVIWVFNKWKKTRILELEMEMKENGVKWNEKLNCATKSIKIWLQNKTGIFNQIILLGLIGIFGETFSICQSIFI